MNTWGKLGTFGANIIMNLQDFHGLQIVSLLFKVLDRRRAGGHCGTNSGV